MSNFYKTSDQYRQREAELRAAKEANKQAHVSHTFVFYHDPAHGYLAVLRADLAQYGLSARDFTRYSHVSEDGTRFYLEEDCDAGKFIEAYKARFDGREPTIKETHIPSSQPHSNFIRRMPLNVAGEWKPFARSLDI